MARPIEVKALPNFRIWLRYDDGTRGEIDLSDLAGRGVFKAWKESAFFNSVRLGSHGAIAWGSDIDICPDAMYLRLTGKSPEKAARLHPMHRVTRFSIVGRYALSVTFADGIVQSIDFEPVLHGALFGPLRESSMFDAVSLDEEAGTLVWPNGADFDPADLHDWPNVKDELAARARAWVNPESNERANARVEPTRG